MPLPLEQCITMKKADFKLATGLGDTKIWQMIRDGRLKAYREGKNVLIIVRSYLDLIAKQQVEGDPGYHGTAKALEIRKERAAKRRLAAANPHATLDELGL